LPLQGSNHRRLSSGQIKLALEIRKKRVQHELKSNNWSRVSDSRVLILMVERSKHIFKILLNKSGFVWLPLRIIVGLLVRLSFTILRRRRLIVFRGGSRS
ncbi:hypothetical protein GIB67_000921, partial [Kingdonia uniflora]